MNLIWRSLHGGLAGVAGALAGEGLWEALGITVCLILYVQIDISTRLNDAAKTISEALDAPPSNR